MSRNLNQSYGKTRLSLLRMALMACVAVFLGCAEVPVTQDADQREAHQIVALLTGHGINAIASKESGGKGRYVVTVARGDYAQAVSITTEKGFPRERSVSFAELIEQQGLIPNSREIESLRLDHAIALELEELFRAHVGVLVAKVVVRVNALSAGTAPGVSVVLQVLESSELDQLRVVESVRRTVPGVAPDAISVSLARVADDGRIGARGARIPLAPFLRFWRIPVGDYVSLALTLFLCMVLVLLVGFAFGFWYGCYQQSRQLFDNELPDGALKLVKAERVKREQGGE